MFTASDNLCFQDVVKVRLSDTERTKGTLTAENLAFAVSAMHRDGVCVLENAVDLNHVSTLNRILVDDAPELAKMPTTHFNNVSESIPHQPDLARTANHETDFSRWTFNRQHVPRPTARSRFDVYRHLGQRPCSSSTL